MERYLAGLFSVSEQLKVRVLGRTSPLLISCVSSDI